MLKQLQDMVLESRKLKKGLFAERILALQKRANFELMSICYDLVHKPVRTRKLGTNQMAASGLILEDTLKDVCSKGETVVELVLENDYEFFLHNAYTPPDKVNILTGKYSIYDGKQGKYLEFDDAPSLAEDLKTKLDPGFIITCKEEQFSKLATLRIEVPMP